MEYLRILQDMELTHFYFLIHLFYGINILFKNDFGKNSRE